MIRVALIEDETRFADTLETLLDHTPGLRCVGRYGTATAALAGLSDSRPQVVLVDLHLPDMEGVELIRRLREAVPVVRPLVLSKFDDPDHVFAAICAGAFGYVLKTDGSRALLDAIEAVHAGLGGMSPSIARRAIGLLRDHRPTPIPPTREGEKLTAREEEVLQALVGHPLWENKEIATALGMSHHTVANHLTRIYTKLHAGGRDELFKKLKHP